MRILVVTPEFGWAADGRTGGAGIYVHHLCQELAHQGHDVDVIAPVEFDLKASRTPFNVYELRLSRRRILGMLKWSIEAYVRSMKLMQTKNYDVVNVHCLSSLYPCLYTSEIPMVIIMHAGWALASPRFSLQIRLFLFLRDLLSCKKSRRIIVFNKSLKQDLLRWGVPPKKIEYVPNAIDRKEFEKEQNNSRVFREKFGIPQDSIVLLCVGRLERGKGVEGLLDAVRMVQNHATRPISVAIVGDGSLRLGLMKRYSTINGVFFTGSISRDDLISAYKESDLFVMPSEGGEGMPTVLLEAMAAGLPIVSTRIPGAMEIVKRDFGTFVGPASPQELASAILDVISDVALLEKMGRSAASLSRQFDWSVIAGKIAQVFESCLESSGLGSCVRQTHSTEKKIGQLQDSLFANRI